MEKKEFEYHYTAPTKEERREIEAIRTQYAPKEVGGDALARLRALDSKVRGRATALSLVVAVLGLLVFGTGLALILEWGAYALGVTVSAVGLVAMSVAYPMYDKVFQAGKRRYGEEILRLSEELLADSSDDGDTYKTLTEK